MNIVNDLILIEYPSIKNCKHTYNKGEDSKIFFYTYDENKEIVNLQNIYLPVENYEVLGKLSQLEENSFKELVEDNKMDKLKTKSLYKNYLDKTAFPFLSSARQSFLTLLLSNDINILATDYLILKIS